MSQPGSSATIGGPCSESRGATIIGVEGVFLFAAACVVVTRMFIRTRILRQTRLDDAAICIAWVLAAVKFGLDCTAVHYGLGEHINCVAYDDVTFSNKVTDISLPIALLSLMFTRLSVCLFLLRLFTVNKNWRYLLYAIMVLIFATNVACAAVILPQCSPQAKLWDSEIPGTCWPHSVQFAMTIFNGAVSAVSDLTLSLLPTYFLWDVQIKLSTKIGVCTVMGLGGLVTACPIVRTVLESNLTSPDITWASVDLTVWTILEIELSMIAASTPALRPILSGSAWRKHKARNWGSGGSARSKLALLFKWSSIRSRSNEHSPTDPHSGERGNSSTTLEPISPTSLGRKLRDAGTYARTWFHTSRSRTSEHTEGSATPPEMIEHGMQREGSEESGSPAVSADTLRDEQEHKTAIGISN